MTGSAAGDAALDKFNKSWMELDDWLTLLDHMVQTQRVMVGDLDEINEMTVKLKVSSYSISTVKYFVYCPSGATFHLFSILPKAAKRI